MVKRSKRKGLCGDKDLASMQEKVHKILARLGLASRRKSEELIREGRVTINGQIAHIGQRIDPTQSHIKVDGRLVFKPEPHVYYLFNKPQRVVSTMSDPEGRKCVGDFLKDIKFKVFPVGRLDYYSEGLMIITNDGDLANAILHPSKKISKTYHVKVTEKPSEDKLKILSKGIHLEDGKTAPAKVKIMKNTEKNCWLEMIIHEGKKRQIRRMVEAIGHRVIRLIRVRIDGISLGDLKVGEIRMMSAREIDSLKLVLFDKHSELKDKSQRGSFKMI